MSDDPPKPPPRPRGCESCDKKCSVYFTRLVAGATTQLGMCADCPNAKALLDPALATPFDEGPAPPPTGTLRCPTCGYTAADFNREKRFGCPLCYRTFGRLLGDVLTAAQPAVTHHGKHPLRHHGMLTQTRLRAAREELRVAIGKEDFESAARLRDEILALEKSTAATEGPAGPASGF